jgi:hypothetical protein
VKHIRPVLLLLSRLFQQAIALAYLIGKAIFLQFVPDFVKLITSRKRLVEYIACSEETTNACRILVGNFLQKEASYGF